MTSDDESKDGKMRELEFMDEYHGQSTDELIQMESGFRIDSLVSAFEEAIDQKEIKAGHSSITQEENVIRAVESLEREVNNGGYSQFFYNSSCKFVPVIVESLKLIGCPKTADLTSKAIAIVGIPENSTHDQFQEKIADDDSLDEKFEPIDRIFYVYEEDIGKCLFEFIKANRTRIIIGNQ